MLRALVIGGGPAGLFAALRLAALRPDVSVAVAERMPSPGRKLLASGSGQCNITHSGPIEDFLAHYGEGGRFLAPALRAFTNDDLLVFFRERGVEFEGEAESGKVFPGSRKAGEILSALRDECARRGVETRCGTRISGLAYGGGSFRVEAESGRALDADRVVLAAGGLSYPKTGSSGDGYALARGLGHSIVEPKPALTSVNVKGFALAGLSGLSFPRARLSLFREGKKVRGSDGPLLVTHGGLSGPLVLDFSRYIEAGDELRIGFAEEGEFARDLDRAIASNPKSLPKTALAEAGLPRALASAIAELALGGAAAGAAKTCASVSRAERRSMIGLAAAFPARVESLGGWDQAMVTAGGVARGEIDRLTMESRIVPGLFFAGEVIDVDGDSGGYNLQAAFSTAALAASGIAASLVGPGIRILEP